MICNNSDGIKHVEIHLFRTSGDNSLLILLVRQEFNKNFSCHQQLVYCCSLSIDSFQLLSLSAYCTVLDPTCYAALLEVISNRIKFSDSKLEYMRCLIS